MTGLFHRRKWDIEVIVKHEEHAWTEACMWFKAAGLNTPAETVVQNAASVLNVSAALARNRPAEKSWLGSHAKTLISLPNQHSFNSQWTPRNVCISKWAAPFAVSRLNWTSFCLIPVIIRRLWHRHQRMGRRGRPSVQEVPPQQPPGGADAGPGPVPPVAWETLRWWAAAGPVPHVHAVQGHERGLARPAGHALLQARDRSSPAEAEAAECKPQENLKTPEWLV